MKIAILGTRGIPNNYGGFEQFAEYLAQGLQKSGVEVSVYNAHNHPYQNKIWNEIRIIHKYDPEFKIGTSGQFIYDLNCILDSRKRKFDLILQLGYTSSSIWSWLLPKKSIIITNMDGLEWKRTKYNSAVKKFLKWAEKLAVNSSDHLVSDSIGIQDYLKRKYIKESTFIAYGANLFENPNPAILTKYNLNSFGYDLIIARMEPENNIEAIIKGYYESNSNRKLVIIGNSKNKFGSFIKDKYLDNRILWLGPIYDIDILNNLRKFSHLYFHGHSVGGTNPSLLEAMASDALIVAHQNPFNQSVLGEEAFYFQNQDDIKNIVEEIQDKKIYSEYLNKNKKKIVDHYNWDLIISKYYQLFKKCCSES